LFAKAIGDFLKKNSKILKKMEYDYSKLLVDYGLETNIKRWYLDENLVILYNDNNIDDPYSDDWEIFKYDYYLSSGEIDYFKPKKISFRVN
ncbi:hypothetical protein ABHA40_13810, partial [Enterococcus mundtii]